MYVSERQHLIAATAEQVAMDGGATNVQQELHCLYNDRAYIQDSEMDRSS